MTRVVHCKKEKYDEYIGRPTNWGNPWTHRTSKVTDRIVESREEAVNNYRAWLLGEDFQNVLQRQRAWILKNLPILEGKTIACWCHPKACHGDVLVEILEQEKRSPGFIASLLKKTNNHKI